MNTLIDEHVIDMNSTGQPFQLTEADTATSEAYHSNKKGFVSSIWLNEDSVRDVFKFSKTASLFSFNGNSVTLHRL